MRILIGVAFAVILGALAWAGVAMLRGGRKEGSKGADMMRALAVRIAVSVVEPGAVPRSEGKAVRVVDRR